MADLPFFVTGTPIEETWTTIFSEAKKKKKLLGNKLFPFLFKPCRHHEVYLWKIDGIADIAPISSWDRKDTVSLHIW